MRLVKRNRSSVLRTDGLRCSAARPSRLPLLLLGTMLTVACSGLERVDAPDVIQQASENDSSGAVLRRNGALGVFAVAYSSQAFESGLLSDELSDESGGQYPEDRRVDNPATTGYPPFVDVSTARVNAIRAIQSLERFAPTLQQDVSELFSMVGFTEVELAEDVCNGVPLATVAGLNPIADATFDRPALLRDAISNFDSAAGHASGDSSLTELAALGKGRALVDAGDFPDAATAVSTVPIGFSYAVTLTSPQTYNFIGLFTSFAVVSVSNDEGINGLDFASASDPRVPVQAVGSGPNGQPVVAFTPYGSQSPMILASGTEAALIAAEAALNSRNTTAWARGLNAVRATLSMDSLPSDSTVNSAPAQQVDLMFRERAFTLFGTGHRLGDLRRLVRQYGRQINQTYPTGPYEGGPSIYGSATEFVIQSAEAQADAAYHGCIDMNP